jgi:putative acetyltransferase
MDLVIAVEDPRAAEVGALLARHLAVMQEETPPAHVHALPTERLTDPAITLFGARRDGVLLGVGAIRRLDDAHAELKSMHTLAEARGQGIGRAMLNHLLQVATAYGCKRVSLETGTMLAFEPARRLYQSAGFRPCPPFGEYTVNPYSVCMTLVLDCSLGEQEATGRASWPSARSRSLAS